MGHYNPFRHNDHVRQAEWRLKKYGIPSFILLTTVIIMDSFEWFSIILHLLTSVIAIVGIWISVRYIAFWGRYIFRDVDQFKKRLLFQGAFSFVVSVLVMMLTAYVFFVSLPYHHHDHHETYIECILMKREIFLAIVSFAFLVNALYENLFNILLITEKEIETENYKKENAEAQFQNLVSKLNPHFLFNSFNTLAALIEEDKYRAVEFVEKLSDVYRYVLNIQEQTWIKLEKELECCNTFLSLLKTRFEDYLMIDIDPEKCDLNTFISPLTLQLLIENAVKHNEISSDRPLTIRISCENDMLVVSNNRQSKASSKNSTGIGLQNLKARYAFLTGKEVVVEENEQAFVVKIPLIKSDTKYENSNH